MKKLIYLLIISLSITLTSNAQSRNCNDDLYSGCYVEGLESYANQYKALYEQAQSNYTNELTIKYGLEAQITSLQNQLNSITPEDGVSQANVDAAYLSGAASVTPEDGINQSHVDAAYAEGAASVTPEDGVNQSHVDAAYTEGAASVTPEDGINQSHVDAAFAEGAASVTPEDGIRQSHVDAATPLSLDIPMSLPEGWSIFGYTCVEPLDVIDGFVSVKESLEIVKDELGLAYLPNYSFNAIGNLKHGEGYQIKLTTSIDDFQFCKTLVAKVFGCTDATAFNYNPDANTEDDSCIAKVFGCTGEEALNYNSEANTNDDSCIAKVYGCRDQAACNFEPEANTDDGSCYNDAGCGCDNPAPSKGLNCQGNPIQIGDVIYGGMVFQINEDGTALVVSMEDVEVMTWSDAQNTTANATTEGYEDWYLPNIDQLESLYNSIGPGGDNSLGLEFQAGQYSSHWKFWSSSITPSNSNYVYILNFVDGEVNENYYPQNWTYSSRPIRSIDLGCIPPAFMNSASDFESPSITSGEVLYVYYDNAYITHFTTSSSSIVTGSTPGYSGNGPRYSDEDYGTGAVQPGVNYYAGTLSSLTSINEANYPYWVGAGDEYIFDTRSFENGGETYDGVGNFSWTNWTSKNLKVSQMLIICEDE